MNSSHMKPAQITELKEQNERIKKSYENYVKPQLLKILSSDIFLLILPSRKYLI